MKKILFCCIAICLLSNLVSAQDKTREPFYPVMGVSTGCLCPDGFISQVTESGCLCEGHQVPYIDFSDSAQTAAEKESICTEEKESDTFPLLVGLLIIMLGLGIFMIKNHGD